MRLNKRQRERLLKENCGVINDDDAIDPKHYFYNKRKNRRFKKAFQLGRQIFETLHMTLNSTSPEFEALSVVDVVPAPDARRFLVIVTLNTTDRKWSAAEIDELLSLLHAHVPQFRSEVAHAIHRRKTPNLVFEFAKLS